MSGFTPAKQRKWILEVNPDASFLRGASPETKARAVKMFRAGRTKRAIAMELGDSATTVKEWIKEQIADTPIEYRATPRIKQQAVEMYKGGSNLAEIGSALGYIVIKP